MEKRAEEIACSMHKRGLQPWHVEEELEVRAIMPMYREKIKEMVVEQLEKLQNY